ncbi:DUF7344 domain-containing protein [Haladaptatus sp. DFWS20]|uniref:DUF7344 domain-containing protein n=1 Tax=Haladaptatus sp. DFWS20 TaxID=3403467 RepID=UPI003EB8E676
MERFESQRLDTVFDALSNGERRRMVQYLTEATDGTATVEELAALGDDPTQSKVRLRHIHLPRLSATKVVEYDERSETVRYRGSPFLERVLDCCLEHDQAR